MKLVLSGSAALAIEKNSASEVTRSTSLCLLRSRIHIPYLSNSIKYVEQGGYVPHCDRQLFEIMIDRFRAQMINIWTTIWKASQVKSSSPSIGDIYSFLVQVKYHQQVRAQFLGTTGVPVMIWVRQLKVIAPSSLY